MPFCHRIDRERAVPRSLWRAALASALRGSERAGCRAEMGQLGQGCSSCPGANLGRLGVKGACRSAPTAFHLGALVVSQSESCHYTTCC